MAETIKYSQFHVEVVGKQSAIPQASGTAQSVSVQNFQEVTTGDKFRVRVVVTDPTGQVSLPKDAQALNVLEITDAGTTVGGGGRPGSVSWLNLTDTPSTYAVAAAGALVRQNLAGDGIDFLPNGSEGQVVTMENNLPTWKANAGTGVTTWLALDDTDPSTYVGQGGKFVQVNSNFPETGLEFHALKAFDRFTVSGETDYVAASFNSSVDVVAGFAMDIQTNGGTNLDFAVDASQINLDDLGAKTFILLTDTPAGYGTADQLVRTSGTDIEYSALTIDDAASPTTFTLPGTHDCRFTTASASEETFEWEVTGGGNSVIQTDDFIANTLNTEGILITDDTTGRFKLLESTTGGDIVYFDATGVPTILGSAADGLVLTATGVGTAPAWESAAGGISDAYTMIQPDFGDLLTAVGTETLEVAGTDYSIVPTGTAGSPDELDLAIGRLTATTPSGCNWADGLFPWTGGAAGTWVMDALCQLNGILATLGPQAAPNLDDIDIDTNGNNAYLTWGTSQSLATYADVTPSTAIPGSGLSDIDIDVEFNDSGDRAGVISGTTDASGTLNEDVPADAGWPSSGFPANAFGNADTGTLSLELNGVEVHSVDLSVFVSGDSLNGSGSGFTSLSAATSVLDASGDPFDTFKYRTGGWKVDSSEMSNGWNYVQVKHSTGPIETNYCDWVVDPVPTSGADSDTEYTGDSTALHNLTMTGSDHLSGVEWYTGGNADYTITIDDAYRNTYQGDNNQVVFNVSGCSFASGNEELDACFLNNQNAKQQVYTDLTVNITNNTRRFGGQSITASTTVQRTFSANETTSATSTLTWMLMDGLIDNENASDLFEDFRDEGYRLPSDFDITSISYSSGPGNGPEIWDSTISLVGVDGGYNDGLQIYNDRCQYPVLDWRIAGESGPYTYSPAGNPDYTPAIGEREYIRYFYSSTATSNFNFNIQATGSTWVAASKTDKNGGAGLAAGEMAAEILAPNVTTDDGGSTIVWKDMVTTYTNDNAVGAFSSTNGNSIPTNWGVTIGTKSTANSGNAFCVRITSATRVIIPPSSWTGWLESITADVTP